MLSQLRSERRRLAAMRVSFVSVVGLVLALAVWLAPQTHLGLTGADYTTSVTAGLVLLGFVAVAVLGFALMWAPQFRREPLPEFLRVLFGAHQLIRNGEQLRSRLAFECRRARRDRRAVFSLVVLAGGSGASYSPIGEAEYEGRELPVLVRSAVRADDIVATTSPRDVWVLLTSVSADVRDAVLARFIRALQAMPDAGECSVGASTFGVDGDQPEMLMGVAQQRLTPLPQVAQERAA